MWFSLFSQERSQALNRFLAWRLLAEKLEALQSGLSQNQQQTEKLRKQKDRRLRRGLKVVAVPTIPMCFYPDLESHDKLQPTTGFLQIRLKQDSRHF